MSFLLGFLLLLPFITVIIAIHEFGHFWFARRFDMKVKEYFIGFGKWKIWSRRKGELEYGVKAILGGGYVKIAGMDPFEEIAPEDLPRTYQAKPAWQRAVVIAAGPLSHFVVAALIFSSLLFIVGDTSTRSVLGAVAARIDGVTSPAAAAGLQPGDEIVAIGDVEHPTPAELGVYQRAHVGEPVAYIIERDGERFEVSISPILDRDGGETIPRIGVLLAPVPRPILSAVAGGVDQTWDLAFLSVKEIGRVFGPSGIGRTVSLLVTDEAREIDDPASVVGISQQLGEVGGEGEWVVLAFMLAYITLFIGLVNLIPLPPLDGGHLAVLLIEKIRGRRVNMRRLIPVSAAVLSFLILFVSATVVLDIFKPVPIP